MHFFLAYFACCHTNQHHELVSSICKLTCLTGAVLEGYCIKNGDLPREKKCERALFKLKNKFCKEYPFKDDALPCVLYSLHFNLDVTHPFPEDTGNEKVINAKAMVTKLSEIYKVFTQFDFNKFSSEDLSRVEDIFKPDGSRLLPLNLPMIHYLYQHAPHVECRGIYSDFYLFPPVEVQTVVLEKIERARKAKHT